MTTKATAQHTLGEGAFSDLMALHEAIDKLQPLADLRGNFAGLHAVVLASEAIAKADARLAPFSEKSSARAAATEMLALLRLVATVMSVETIGHRELKDQARALLARIEGQG